MLSRILEEFRKSDKPLDLKELSRRLSVERSALEGMLDLLVRQGKLRKLCPDIKPAPIASSISVAPQRQRATCWERYMNW